MQAVVEPPSIGPGSCRWNSTFLLGAAAGELTALHICVGRFMDHLARQRGRDVHHFKDFQKQPLVRGATRCSQVPAGSLLSTRVSQETWALD